MSKKELQTILKLSKSFDYVRKLPLRIRQSLTAYTGASYKLINEALRRGIPITSEKDKEIVMDIYLAFEGAPPIDQPLTVYRGVEGDEAAPTIPTLRAFLSTSLSENEAVTFMGKKKCCLLRILIPAGARILPLIEVSEIPHEKEILLSPEAELIITNVGF